MSGGMVMTDYDLMHRITTAGDTSIDAALRSVIKLAETYSHDSFVNEEFNQGLQVAFRLVIDAIKKEL